MAETTGPTDRSVIDALLAHPRRFAFYQAVRLLERHTGATRVGFRGPSRGEALRFRPHPSMAFPISDVEQIESEENPGGRPETRYRITSTFLGLYGSSSPLPLGYAEILVREDDRWTDEDRERLRSFLDIFHHRLYSLFYRCMSKYRYHLLYEPGGEDSYSRYMLSLIGRGTAGMPNDRPIGAIEWVRYAGIVTQQPKSGETLRGLIADFFQTINVAIEQCTGRWLSVEDRNQVGEKFSAMGEDLVVGSRVYDRGGKFRVSLGPMGLKEFKRFLPNGEAMAKLTELVRFYLLDELEFDVEVWLKGDEVPPLRLGQSETPPMLGWTSWAVEGPGPDRAVVFRT